MFAWTQKDSFDESFMVNLWSIVCFAHKLRNHAPITKPIGNQPQPPIPSGFGTLKTADRPLLILTLIPNDKHPRPQIRNSQRYLQTPVNQRLNTTRIFSALRLPSSTLRNMPFRGAIDGLSQHDRWSFEMRYMPNLNSKHAFSQNVGAKRPFRFHQNGIVASWFAQNHDTSF